MADVPQPRDQRTLTSFPGPQFSILQSTFIIGLTLPPRPPSVKKYNLVTKSPPRPAFHPQSSIRVFRPSITNPLPRRAKEEKMKEVQKIRSGAKAVEGCRTSGRFAKFKAQGQRASVLELMPIIGRQSSGALFDGLNHKFTNSLGAFFTHHASRINPLSPSIHQSIPLRKRQKNRT